MIIKGATCDILTAEQECVSKGIMMGRWSVSSLDKYTKMQTVIRGNCSEEEAEELLVDIRAAIEDHKTNPRTTPFDAVGWKCKKRRG